MHLYMYIRNAQPCMRECVYFVVAVHMLFWTPPGSARTTLVGTSVLLHIGSVGAFWKYEYEYEEEEEEEEEEE